MGMMQTEQAIRLIETTANVIEKSQPSENYFAKIVIGIVITVASGIILMLCVRRKDDRN